MEALLELEAKEITAKTMKSLDDLSGVGDADVTRIADSIRARLSRLVQGEMRAASLDKQMDEALAAASSSPVGCPQGGLGLPAARGPGGGPPPHFFPGGVTWHPFSKKSKL